MLKVSLPEKGSKPDNFIYQYVDFEFSNYSLLTVPLLALLTLKSSLFTHSPLLEGTDLQPHLPL
jgi:hypothetical protein